MERYREEIDNNTTTTFHSSIRIFGQLVRFRVNKNSDQKYELKGLFEEIISINKEVYYYADKVFYENSFSSYDELMVQYNMLVEKAKQKESFLELKYMAIEKAYINSSTNSNYNSILSECNICTEKIGNNYCSTCGYCVCSFCISLLIKNDKYKCPQCKTTYVDYHHDLNTNDSESDSDDDN